MQRRVREKYITEKLRAWRCVDYRTGVYLLTELCFTLEYDKCARSGLRKLLTAKLIPEKPEAKKMKDKALKKHKKNAPDAKKEQGADK